MKIAGFRFSVFYLLRRQRLLEIKACDKIYSIQTKI